MANPLSFLAPAINLLGDNVRILPTTGGAVEDLQHPDVDEVEDTLLNREVGEITDFAETPTPSLANLYHSTPPLFRPEKHLYRFFIDGSLRTYYLATGIEGQRSFPIQLAQIGAAVMERDAEGCLSCLKSQHRVLLLVPTREHGLSDTVWQQLQRLRTPDGFFEPIDITEKTALTPREPTGEDLRTRAGGIARHRMHRLEIELIEATEAQRNEDAWLILDGAVKLDDFIRAPYLVGVAKSFRKDPEFRFGRGRATARRDIIQSILQRAPDPEKIAVIILNVKQADLLQIDLRPEHQLPPEQMALWEALGLEPRPFQNVRYLLPRGWNRQANSYPPVPGIHIIYAYDLEGTADKLDMLFSNVADPSGTMEGIYGEIMTGITGRDAEFKDVQSWAGLLEFLRQKQSAGKWRGMFASSSIGAFRRHLRRIVQTRQTGIFVDSRARHEKLLSDELVNLKGGYTYVVDIAKLADEEQTLVFGDILRTIYAVKAEEAENRTEQAPVPEKVIIFVDELNKYAPSGPKASPITQQVLDVAERGRSLGVILISAQQFMSAVHDRVTGNCATKILGRTGSAEVMQPDYRFLEQDLKMAVTRLIKGELLLSHAVYRQPVKVIFPLPAYRQEQA